MKRLLKTAAALLLGASMLITGALAANTSFSDVPSSHWAYSYVTRAAQEGLVSGMGDGTYGENQKLNIGQFAVMLCGLLYPEADDPYAGKSSYYWYQYAEAAYQKGDLSGTVAGNRRASDGAWTATVVEAPMSRYDLAQIIANVIGSQGWPSPESAAVTLAMIAIPDWSEIPSNYQAAVALAYAGGFLTGMEGGVFNGESSMTRSQAAVVLCALLDAKEEQESPTYTNRDGKLVNGEDANEDNVRVALSQLKREFYEFYVYDTDRSYTSQRLGTATGGRGFAYMLSDRVFGNLPAEEQDDPDQLKPGDIVYLQSEGDYVVVTEVQGNNFDYVYCDSMGILSWQDSGRIDDLGSRDTIWTRYEGSGSGEMDESDVEDALADLEDEYYGERWTDDDYDSDVLGASYGYSEAFAYRISDELFGDLEDTRLDPDDSDVRLRDIRVGDLVELRGTDDNGETVYGIVLAVDEDDSRDQIQILFAEYDDYEDEYYIARDWVAFDDLYWIYTRYSDDVDDRNDLDESDVEDLIDEFLAREYDEDEYCDECEDGYRSPEFGGSTYYGDRAFAYYLSDYIFGKNQEVDEMDGDQVDIDDIRLGDVIHYNGGYYVVTSVNTSNERLTCLYTDEDDRVSYATLRLSNFEWSDTIYTRYDDGAPNHSSGSLTTREVENRIEDFRDEEYDVGNTCDECEDGYRSPEFRSGKATGSEAFAYYMSDYIFGEDRAVDEMPGNEVYFEDLRLGDVIYLEDHDRYGVIVSLDEDEELADYLYAQSSGRVRLTTLNPMEMGSDDTLYTRY